MAERPYFRCHVFCCTNIRPEDHPRGSCGRAGSSALRDHLKARAKAARLTDVRVNTAGCLDRCEYGPVIVVYPEGIWYGVRETADLDEILESHLINGVPVARLQLPAPGEPEEPAGG